MRTLIIICLSILVALGRETTLGALKAEASRRNWPKNRTPVHVPPPLPQPRIVEHICGYDYLQRKPPLHVSAQEYGSRTRTIVKWEPIRITLITDYLIPGRDPYACLNASTFTPDGWYCTTGDILTPEKRTYIETVVLPAAISWITATYTIKPVVGNLSLGLASCSMDYTQPVLIPHRNLPNTDLAIFVTARPLATQYLALALACDTDTKGRAIAGHIDLNPINVITGVIPQAQVIRDQEMIHTAIHELHHVLGFNYDTFDTFVDPVTDQQLLANQSAIVVATRQMGATSYSFKALRSPAAVEAARLHFGCSTLNYIPLEDGGGTGTALSHWEKRVLMNEFITGSIGLNPIISNITLAIMHDSGWYHSNWNMSEQFLWGKGEGCSFVTGSCNPAADGFCNSAMMYECTWDRLASGQCNLDKSLASPIPVQNQYYNSSIIGGTDSLADNCPYVVPFSTGDCRFGVGISQSGFNFGGQGDWTSRCLQSSLVQGDAYRAYAGSCYPVKCFADGSIVVRINYVWYPCPWGTQIGAVGFNGTAYCPFETEVDKLCSVNESGVEGWPVFDDITPNHGGSGTFVVISGRNFQAPMIANIGGFNLIDVTVVNTSLITARFDQLPINFAAFVPEATYIILNTSQGYTAVELDVFILDQGILSDTFLQMILNWIKANPIIIALVVVALVAVIAIAVFFVVRRNMSRKQRIADTERAREEEADKRRRRKQRMLVAERTIQSSHLPI